MELKQVALYDIRNLWKVSKIISQCGLDMYNKYALRHWLNSTVKTFLIVIYTSLRDKRKVYSLQQDNILIATYQASKVGKSFKFGKFAVSPKMSGKGIGSECIHIMTQQALQLNCSFLECEVFDRSDHAIHFYLNRGFLKNGECNTLKYSEIKLIKQIKE